MELQRSKSRFEKKNMHKEHVIGIPINSSEYAFSFKSSSKALLPDPASQYQLVPSPSKQYSKMRHNRVDSITTKMIKLGQSMDIFAQGIREHVRIGPKLSETVKGKLSLGARILQLGGLEKVFKQKFNINRDDEKLLKASQCYLSTTAGPIAGLLFISNNRLAFSSERSIKVMIPLGKIKRAVESKNVEKPTHKNVQVVMEENFEFWFMGFLNHQRTLKYLQQAIHQAR
ncbi:hypothetical protein CDL12_30163 [Handroanthus impetiginosus]|uniref:GRAM domain-containing protein n=1 Tax=Handroanthus impetiginosus TaxID=429701 RepID=A0A2G9FWC8_9LAMI|nr:hypothetical protein CDL12_30163 [Handroanthus impetiginosus]